MGDDDSVSHTPEATEVGILDALAFGCELAMLALLVAAGRGIADGWQGWLLGVALALVAVGIWGWWMAPTSRHRLDNPARFVVQAILFVSVAVTAAIGGLMWWGVAFALLSTGLFAALLREA